MISKATETDYKQCCILAKESKFIRPFIGTSYRWGWKDNLFVYKEDEIIKGFIQFNLCKRVRRATLYYVIVSLEHRKEGIGKKLFEFYKDKAGERYLSWKVDIRNTEAVDFYRRLGYEGTNKVNKNYIFEYAK